MSSANHLDEGNIRVKSNENNSKGSGDMEQTQNSRIGMNTVNLSFVCKLIFAFPTENICVSV